MERANGVAPLGATRAEQVLLGVVGVIAAVCLAGGGVHALGGLPPELAGLARPLLSLGGAVVTAAVGLYAIRRLARPGLPFRWTREAAIVFVVAAIAFRFARALGLYAYESPTVLGLAATLLAMVAVALFVDVFHGAAAGALSRWGATGGIAGGVGLLLFAGGFLTDAGLLFLAALPLLCVAGGTYLGARLAARRELPR